jgi:GNAT superfamily N-acetyltransferase
MSITLIKTSDMPDIKGLSFCSIRGEVDADALYAVHTGRIAHDKIDLSSHYEDLPSHDRLRKELSQAVADGEQDLWLVAQIDERTVGYSQLACWPEEDGMWVYFIGGWVLPEWRGQGIGTAMLHWGETRARPVDPCLTGYAHTRRGTDLARYLCRVSHPRR